jgi:DNA-binding beta-propeller fold protein YncE
MKLHSRFALLLPLVATVVAVAQEPTFLHRLEIPVAHDDIGYGHAVTADPHTGEVFVCDTKTNRILIFDPDGLFSFQIMGGETFYSPRDLAVDPEGFLLVLGSRDGRNRPLELDFDGTFIGEIPLPELDPSLSPARYTSLALSVDGTRIFLLDGNNLRLWIHDRQGGLIRSVDLAEGLPEAQRRDMFLGQVDTSGDFVLIAIPSFGQVRRYDLEGQFVGSVGIKGAGPCNLGRPMAAALTEDGEILVIDQQRMVLGRWSAAGNRCIGDHFGYGSAQGLLYYPADLALDGNGRIYIAQSALGRVQVYQGDSPALGWVGDGTTARGADSQ